MEEPCLIIYSSKLGRETIAKRLEEIIRGAAVETNYRGIVADPDETPPCRVIIGVVATGGTEHLIMESAEQADHIALVYHDYANSLPATIEVLAALREIGKRVIVRRLPLDPEQARKAIGEVARILGTSIRIRNSRLGLIGGVSPWLVYSRLDPSMLEERLGARLVGVELDDVVKYYRDARIDEKLLSMITGGAENIYVDPSNISRALKLYTALKRIVDEYRFNALTIKCFDLITRIKTTACLALSLLNKEGIVSACEGDVPSMISMILASWTTGQPAFMANIAGISNNEVILAHCTAPLTNSYDLYTHYESGIGVGLRIKYPVGETATILRIDNKLQKLRIGVGTIRPHEWGREMCRTQVRVELENPSSIIEDSIGNHYIMILGDHKQTISDAGRILGLKPEYL